VGRLGAGFAVANAHPEVLALADEVTASNDADGVGRLAGVNVVRGGRLAVRFAHV